jgi:hypothetical protein
MFSEVKVWTLFGKDEPEVFTDVHDIHIGGGSGIALLIFMANGDQIGFYMPNVRRWEATKKLG